VINKTLEPKDGGVIAVDKSGNYVMAFNTASMFRGVTGDGINKEVKIWKTK